MLFGMAIGTKHNTFRYFPFYPLDTISIINGFGKAEILFLRIAVVKMQGSRMIFSTVGAL